VLERVKLVYNKYGNLYEKIDKMDKKKMMEVYPHMNKDFGRKEKRWKDNLKVIRNDSNLIKNLKMMKTFIIILIKKEKKYSNK